MMNYCKENCISNSNGLVCIGADGEFVFNGCEHVIRSAATATSRCKVISHRGHSHIAPENTIASVAASIAIGSDACEFDVRCTADGHVVLMHDASVDRTTNGTGEISEMTLAQAQTLDAGSWKGSGYIGEKMPSLAEVFQLMSAGTQHAVVEIKDPAAACGIVALAHQYYMTEKVIVLSEDSATLQQIKSIDPKITRALLCIEMPREVKIAGTEIQWLIDRAHKASARVIDIDYRLVSAQLIATLHRNSFQTWVWTVNSPEIMKFLIAWGVDAVASDKPDVLMSTIAG